MNGDRRLHAALLPYQPRLLHDVLDSLDIAVVVLDETSRVLAGNVAASRLLGVRRGRRAGDIAYEPVSVTDEAGAQVDVLAYDVWHAVAASRSSLLVRVRREDGTVRWLTVVAELVGVATDTPAVVCRYTDVTAARALEGRAAAAANHAARAEIDLVAAEQRVALLEDLLVQITTAPRSDGRSLR
ncbi:MAG TPA: PAS domain S-box protein [Frankiaceae bacterium]|jgi:PAS domain S-box-containing protein|nr:PAS domain S-box protein [Frankiaceae bacterium]